MSQLLPYKCRVCHETFCEPVDGACPVCHSYDWGDKRVYYKKLKKVKKANEERDRIIREKLSNAKKGEKK